MRKGVIIVGLLLTAFISNGQSFERSSRPTADSLPVNDRDHKNRIVYDVFVRSYFDSNRDGNGDLNGLSSKLANIRGMGAEGVCLSPINPSPSYDNFDVTNFYKVDSVYGDTASLKKLVSTAHQLKLKVFLNLPVNHCSTKHPWFVSAVSGKSSQYSDYFIWKDEKSISGSKDKWHSPVDKNGKKIPGKKFYGSNGSKAPDFNFSNAELRAEVMKIGTFWLKEFDLDGFKIDGVELYFDAESVSETNKWWKEFHSEMKKTKAGFYLAGNVISGDNKSFVGNGFDALVNHDISSAIINVVKNEVDSGLVIDLLKVRSTYSANATDFIDIISINNEKHDRSMTLLNGDQEKSKLAATLLFTLPGSPYLYYGEEVGMFGKLPKEYIREPYLWSTAKNAGGKTKWEASKYNTQDVKSFNVSSRDSASVFSHYKKLMALRRTTPALNGNGFENVKVSDNRVISFLRYSDKQKVLIVMNLTNKDLDTKIDFRGVIGSAIFENGKVVIDGEKMICSPHGVSVFLVN